MWLLLSSRFPLYISLARQTNHGDKQYFHSAELKYRALPDIALRQTQEFANAVFPRR